MNIIKLKKSLSSTVFSHEELAIILQAQVSNVNAKISYMVKQGILMRLKKGLYTFGFEYQDNSMDTILVANLLYTPSYVSFDYALSYYGLIPERVYEVTSATLHSKKLFETPIGRFSYRPIPIEVYALGVDWLYDDQHGGRFIATPEKALCDKIRGDRGIGRLKQTQIREYLVHDLRIEWEALLELDVTLIEEIAKAYKSYNIKSLSGVIKRSEYA
ncbi:MAG: hypothetical protein KU38_11730 [Sulfurovum sp. FS08-3]|nr:MAG: hypothetical protein KU38_11730 [Sulfurovum sp. FS08-3]